MSCVNWAQGFVKTKLKIWSRWADSKKGEIVFVFNLAILKPSRERGFQGHLGENTILLNKQLGCKSDQSMGVSFLVESQHNDMEAYFVLQGNVHQKQNFSSHIKN